MQAMRAGKAKVITCHIMTQDSCNHSCAFCSVAARAGDSLNFDAITGFVDALMPHGLRSCIISGGGNPILYKCKKTGKDFNAVVDAIHARGLEIGLITNGMPLKAYEVGTEHKEGIRTRPFRQSWKTVRPETLDKLTWIRISMSGLDHEENEVYVPDIDQEKTTLGFSYVAHDAWEAPEDPHHGKVSTEADMLSLGVTSLKGRKVWRFEERLPKLMEQIGHYVKTYKPRYVRVLPNCLEVDKIEDRCQILQGMAFHINAVFGEQGYQPVFVQHKPPQSPKACFLGYIHPVLNCDGYVYPCDSLVLNESANHQFANPWRICHWKDISKIYEQPVRSLIANPKVSCPGCVFSQSNAILGGVVDGTADLTPPTVTPTHVNFV